MLAPPVREWVRATFGELTPPQVAAIPAVHAGRHVLVSAPTGTGKTLASFLAVLSELIADHQRGDLRDGIHAVYISPLRALGYDVQRNLERPLAEICASHLPGHVAGDVPVRVASRTGDTSPADRRKLVNKPPHILVTTPESLAILLSTPSMRPKFGGVRWVVVDEVHAMAGNKRGVHLALSLERLAHAAGRDPVRVGLSATVSPLDAVARWLVGSQREADIISWTMPRDAVYSLGSVLTGQVVPNPSTVQRGVATAVAARVDKHRTTLVFTNTRGAAERLAHRLKERFGDDAVAAHHSSLAREERFSVESRLREGALRAVVTSTSLELGIDIGTVDETVLVGSPRDVTRALQRVGRSGHRIDRHPAGHFIATGADDLIECAAVAERCRAGALDPVTPPRAPLDVLAQQLVGMSVEGDWRDVEAFALVRRAAPYAKLARRDFDAVLDYLSEASEAMEERRVYAKIEREGRGANKVFRARGRAVATIYHQNVGTIAGGASVRVKPRGSATPIGTVEESFLESVKPGDRFLLGGRVWSFMYAQGMTAFVAPATGRPSVPRWASEILPATSGVARGVGEMRAWMRDALRAGGESALADQIATRFGVSERDAAALASYAAAQDVLSPIPSPDEILIERWTDTEDERLVVHAVTAPLGRRANEALARAIAYRLGRGNAGLLVDDQSFALRTPKRAAWQEEHLAGLFNPSGLAVDVARAVARSDLWGRRFRQVASIGLMLVKNYRGHSKFVGGMQLNARRIWSVLERERPDFPLVRETYRTVLEDDLDVATAEAWLREGRGQITLRDVASVPPFQFRLVAAGTTDAMLLEERDAFVRRLWERAQALATAEA
ncbi:MAG: DEAD/DEAH box helicase [Gemmatimonadota bacterium]|nr:DEAD/DEAH box helicase [Gemmatimonadota bacterium]